MGNGLTFLIFMTLPAAMGITVLFGEINVWLAVIRGKKKLFLVVSFGQNPLHSFEIMAEENRIDILNLAYGALRFDQMFLVLLELVLKLIGHNLVTLQH
jgi:hypothetical protein